VLGIEITQSVQFFRPPVNIVAASGRTGPQPENDIPLVARKATVLRVYIENVADVSGTLEWRAVRYRLVSSIAGVERAFRPASEPNCRPRQLVGLA
jgi:hypothetical protein